jgi:cell division protein FtsB
MSGFPILDLVVGMIFIFFLLSITCSSAVEIWFTIGRTRASMLERWLRSVFDAPALKSDGTPAGISVGQAIMDHCTAKALSGKGRSPTYINPTNFVSALMDKITLLPSTEEGKVQLPPKNLSEYIEAIKASGVISGELKRTFLALAYEAEKAAGIQGQLKSELDHFRDRLENWYNKNAERLTGKFKSTRVMPLTFVVAVVLTVLLNADSVAIGRYLYQNREVTRELANQAMITVGKYNDRIGELKAGQDTTVLKDAAALQTLNQNVQQLRQEVRYLKDSVSAVLPLGWKEGRIDLGASGKHTIGWLASILAICLGAPFWFDVLNKIANLRSTGVRPPTDRLEK